MVAGDLAHRRPGDMVEFGDDDRGVGWLHDRPSERGLRGPTHHGMVQAVARHVAVAQHSSNNEIVQLRRPWFPTSATLDL